MAGWFWRFAPALGLAALAVACTSAPPPPPAPPLDPAAACLAGLDSRGIGYRRLEDWTTPEGCGISQAVEVDRSAIPWNRPAPVSCPMAATIWDFETGIVQPAALRIFGQKVEALSHAGTYACRPVRNTGKVNRISQHALGQAIDLTAFRLADGTLISVRRDWRDRGRKGEFLHTIARGACSLFSVVLTPNHDSYHLDHVHMDIGPYKLCGI